jgi:hypothetical protein
MELVSKQGEDREDCLPVSVVEEADGPEHEHDEPAVFEFRQW